MIAKNVEQQPPTIPADTVKLQTSVIPDVQYNTVSKWSPPYDYNSPAEYSLHQLNFPANIAWLSDQYRWQNNGY